MTRHTTHHVALATLAAGIGGHPSAFHFHRDGLGGGMRTADEARAAGHAQELKRFAALTGDPDERLTFGTITTDVERREFSRLMGHYLRTGEPRAPGSLYALTTGSGSGAMLPKVVLPFAAPAPVSAFEEALRIYGLEPILSDRGTLNVPVLDAEAGAMIAQDATADTTNNPDADESVVMGAPKLFTSGTVWISNSLLKAQAFDFTAAMLPQLRYVVDLAIEAAIGAAIVADAAVTAEVETATPTGFTLNNLIDLDESLPAKYQAHKVIALSPTAYTAARKMVDADGRPILLRDPTRRGMEMTGSGTPVIRARGFETLAADNVVGAVFSLFGFRLRKAATPRLVRYDAVPTRPDQTGVNLFDDIGWGYAPSAVAKLVTSAA